MCHKYLACTAPIRRARWTFPRVLLLVAYMQRKPFNVFPNFQQRDTYFVIRGLLLSDLDGLAKDMIQNLLDFVETYGFMRKYQKPI